MCTIPRAAVIAGTWQQVPIPPQEALPAQTDPLGAGAAAGASGGGGPAKAGKAQARNPKGGVASTPTPLPGLPHSTASKTVAAAAALTTVGVGGIGAVKRRLSTLLSPAAVTGGTVKVNARAADGMNGARGKHRRAPMYPPRGRGEGACRRPLERAAVVDAIPAPPLPPFSSGGSKRDRFQEGAPSAGRRGGDVARSCSRPHRWAGLHLRHCCG
jgi:hypothetical protein